MRSRPIRIVAVVAALAAIAMVALTGTGERTGSRSATGSATGSAGPAPGGPAVAGPIGEAVLIRGEPALTNAEAVVLGLVEGITEYLPVSSTGHLLVAERAMDLDTEAERAGHKDALDAYTVAIQIGAIAAVLGVFRRRVGTLFAGLVGRSDEGRRVLVALVVAFIPAAVIGLLGEQIISDRLLQPWPVVAAWIVGGAVLLTLWRPLAARTPMVDDVTSMTWQHALAIGGMQAIALWPGTSRSFVTILGGLLIGLSMTAAVEFSFLLGLVTLSAATLFSLARHGGELADAYGYRAPLIGIVVAGLSAWVTVRWMLRFLTARGLAVFGWYRIAVGVAVGGLLVAGVL